MRFIVVDLEATCWENLRDYTRMEAIEIGAVELLAIDTPPERDFARFVRPTDEPVLSDFCRRLTTIRQRDVDRADTFPVVLGEFLEWVGTEPFALCSWGGYDLTQFRTDCARHGIDLPTSFENHRNLKREFARRLTVKECGMERALSNLGIPLTGTHHRGIDDAWNIARIAVAARLLD